MMKPEDFEQFNRLGGLRVAIIGFGLGGLAIAVGLKRAAIETFIVFEKNAGPGGTWWENTYPGAQVDTPSSMYCYSFKSNYDWPSTHANQPDILRYIEETIDEYGVRPHCRFSTSVLAVEWNEATHSYTLRTESGEAFEFDIVVSAVGTLNSPAYPSWPGLDDFRGVKFHTARWDHQLDMRAKRVAVVGTGSTAVQVVAAIASSVGKLLVFQREPGHIAPKGYRTLDAAERNLLLRSPVIRRFRRIRDWIGFHRRSAASTLGTSAAQRFKEMCEAHIAAKVRDPELRKALTPRYAFFCKRAVIDDYFYPTLNRDNVQLVPRAVERVTPTGLVDSAGVEHEIDVLIMATGFHATDYLRSLHVKGRGGRSIHDVWETDPRALMGLSVPGFPNFFILYGPNTNAGGSTIFQLECQARWIVDTVKQMRRQKATAIDTKPELFARFYRWIDKGNSRKAWSAGGCKRNYFVSPSGRVVTQWPYSMPTLWMASRVLRRIAYAYQRLPVEQARKKALGSVPLAMFEGGPQQGGAPERLDRSRHTA